MNGLSVENNEIKYLTALGSSNTAQSWRDKKMNGGILMEYPSGKIILDGLSMPHSPKLYNGKLYLLNSAKVELLSVNPNNGTYEVVLNLGAFARCMSLHGDYLFIGVSKLRHNSKAFADLEIAKTSFSGIIAVYLPYKTIVGSFKYEMSVDEIYDVKVIDKYIRPSILDTEMEVHRIAITTPDGSFWNLSTEAENYRAKTQIKFTFQLIKSIRKQDLFNNLSVLLFSNFKETLNDKNFNPNLNAIVTLADNKAVAMTIFELKEDKTAQIYSIFVLSQFRKQSVAKNMLLQIDKLFAQNKISYSEAICNKQTVNVDIIQRLFNKLKTINLIIE